MSKLSKLATALSATFAVHDAADVPQFDGDTPLTITMHGPGSGAFNAATARATNQTMERMRRKGKLDQSAEQRKAEQIEMLVATTISFNGFGGPDDTGTTDPEEFRKVWADPELGFNADRFLKLIGDHENFMKPSPTT